MGLLEFSKITDGQQLWKLVWHFLIKTHLTYVPATSLLSVYLLKRNENLHKILYKNIYL